MAKKKEIVLRSGAEEVPAGDVNITYEGTRIAGFSEETDATLKTGGTRVLSDIDVSYTGPLPASTAEDAGKVLTVGSTGAAEWAAASGGDIHNMILNAVADPDTGNFTYTLASDFDAAVAAIAAYRPIVLSVVYDYGNDDVTAQHVIPSMWEYDDNSHSIMTQVEQVTYQSMVSKAFLIVMGLSISNDNSVTPTLLTLQITTTPVA